MTLLKTAVLIPGWASDYRIFDCLSLPFSHILRINPALNFEEKLLETINKNNIKKISLFGWSMGGFIAADFASMHKDLIDALILVSIRKKYPHEGLNAIKEYLIKNKKAYLYKFYNECFYLKEDMSWFKKNLLKEYCDNMPLDYLIKTLDYLKNAHMDTEALKDIKDIKIIHGEFDKIASIKEAQDIADKIAGAKFILVKDAGHIPFLKKGFAGYL